jgi:hypothetical protein
MSNESSGIPQEFLLKQLENEINAGFVFVAAARNAYQHQQSSEGDGALEKAAEAYRRVQTEMSESPAARVRAITHQLSDLREAIDGLRASHFSRSASGRSG